MGSINSERLTKDERKLRICLVASAGGHLTQLLELGNSWKDHDIFWVVTSDLVREKLQRYGSVYTVTESNRQHPLRVIEVLFSCIRIIFWERPRVVISTGAAVGCLVCFVSKIMGAKIIWVDSITNVNKPSLSGRMVRHIADLFLVQWPELAQKYENAEFAGVLI